MKISGSSLAAAFGRPDPYSHCASCKHKRWQHRREVDNSSGNIFHMTEEHFECSMPDRRRKTNRCNCEHYAEEIATAETDTRSAS